MRQGSVSPKYRPFVYIETSIIMGPKLEIALTTHSTSELQPIVQEFFASQLVESQQLFGGYSGSNYRIVLHDGRQFCLKIANGCSPQQSELMCRTAYTLEQAGFRECCLPLTKPSKDDEKDSLRFVSLQDRDGEPAFVLTFVRGTQADKVMRGNPALAPRVMYSIGGGLARMHAAVSIAGRTDAKQVRKIRWFETDGGCCDVQEHIDNVMLKRIEASPRKDEFLPFYLPELACLKGEMSLKSHFPMGITHGDPFGDNILVDPATGDLIAFIDIEDICAGPLLFDLACCAIGCCFDDESPAGETVHLNISLLESLFRGYSNSRQLSALERDHFVPFMKLALLCNCSWRFIKFNGPSGTDKEFPQQAKDSYLELQKRIEYLQNPAVVEKINTVITKEHS